VRLHAADDDAPLQGAAVRCTTLFPLAIEHPIQRANADGEVFFERLPAGHVDVVTEWGGAVEGELESRGSLSLDCWLPPTLAAEGVVFDLAGAPAVGASIYRDSLGVWTECARSGSDGRFRAERLPSGVTLAAAARGTSLGTRRRVLEDGPGSTRADIVLTLGEPGVELRGRVLDESGAPIPEVMVRCGRVDEPAIGDSLQFATLTAADGSFAISHLADRAVWIRLTHPDHAPLLDTLPLTSDFDTPREWRMASDAELTGVVELHGEPAEGVVVWVGFLFPLGWTVSDERGEFRITGLPARELPVVAACAVRDGRLVFPTAPAEEDQLWLDAAEVELRSGEATLWRAQLRRQDR